MARDGRTAKNYLLAVFFVTLATVARWAMGAYFGTIAPFITFYPAVILVVLVTGEIGPALLAVVLSAIGADYLFLPPIGSLRLEAPGDLAALVVFAFCGVLLALISRRLATTRIAEAIRESELRFRLALRNAPVSVAAQDHNLRYIWAYNQRSAQSGEIVGRLDSDIFTPEESAHITEMKRRVLQENIELREQMWLNRPSGRMFLDVLWEPIRDGVGRAIGVASATVDLTATKLAEEAVRESEQRWSTTLASIGDGVIAADAEGGVTFMNAVAQGLTGWTLVEAAGKPVTDVFRIINEQTRMTVESPVAKVLREGTVVGLANHTILLKKDGAEVPIDDSGAPIRDKDGNTTGVVLVFRDITDRKVTGEALKESEAKYRNLFENMTEEVHFWKLVRDGGGRITTWRLVDANPPTLKTWGKTLGEIKGKTTDEIFGPGAKDHYMALVEKVMTENVPYSYEDYFPNLDKYFRFTTIPLGDSFITTGADISIYKHAERALREAHDKLEQRVQERTASLKRQADLLELAYEAIIVRDPESRVAFWNERAEQLYGWTKSEAIGMITHDLLKTLFPVPFDEHMAVLMKEGHWMGELVHTAKDGRRIIVHSRQALQRDETGQPLAILEINLDITQQKRAEGEIRRYASQLELSNRELQDFAFVASHDLQEPLRKIQAFGDQLKAGYGERLDSEGLDYLARMHNAASRMQALIQALLNYSRVTTKARPFSLTDLASVARDVASDLEARIAETGGRVEVGDLPEIEADPTQMRQLIQNLVGNALKFHGKEKPVVRIYGRPRDGQYAIFVEDNGIGFEEKYLDRIFTPFQRLHGRGVYEGTGIGLAICRKIVDRHGGTITAKSSPGSGSTFIVTLPAKQPKGEI